MYDLSMSVFDASSTSQLTKNVKKKVLVIKGRPGFFSYLLGLVLEEMENTLRVPRNCGRWSDVEAVKLPKIKLDTAILAKIISINILDLNSW